MDLLRVTNWCHHFVKNHVKSGDICIDATVGNGNDTMLLCQLAGDTGKVYGFDIQDIALTNTKKRAIEEGFCNRLSLICHGHENMDIHIPTEEHGLISCIMFNFGYLPGGNHQVVTKADTSIEAIDKALSILRKGGMISLCIYSGEKMGFTERDAILSWLGKLDNRKYLVIVSHYYNRGSNPPIPALIFKL